MPGRPDSGAGAAPADGPVFIFSLDCEGRWGAADRLAQTGYDRFTSAALDTAYRRLVALFDRYEVPATFAFVSCLFLTPDEVRDHADWFAPLPVAGADWFAPFRRDFSRGRYDGWLCPAALDAVRASGGHEIASHGFSHAPLGQDDVSEALFRREMESVRAAEALRGLRSDTFIYPRNRNGHLMLLPAYGFRAYRPAVSRVTGGGAFGKIVRLLDDVNPFEPPVAHGIAGHPVVLPAGRLLPVRRGARRWLPAAMIRRKFEAMLDRAIAGRRVVHVFAHPHNFLTGHGQYALLEGLLTAVSGRVRGGELRVLTQTAYCEGLTGGAAAGSAPGGRPLSLEKA